MDYDSIEINMINKLAYAYDLNTLNKIKDELIKKNEDLDLINKAIKRKQEIMKANEKRKEDDKKQEVKLRRMTKAAFFSALLGGISNGKKLNKDLTGWEVMDMSDDFYEPMNFEEENMDEDDYYSDDLD